MAKKRMRRKDIVKKIALERIYRLFELAEQSFEKQPERSKRYVELALKIGKHCNVSVPTELKKKFCKKCGAFLKAGVNSKIRIAKHILKVTCLNCGYTRKIRAQAYHATKSLRKRSGIKAETAMPKSKKGPNGGKSR
jgi:ribonuclease P protein subunit RPR2